MDCDALKEVEFLIVRHSLLIKLGSGEALRRQEELAYPLVYAERYHISQSFHHVGHVWDKISEVIRESDELEEYVLESRVVVTLGWLAVYEYIVDVYTDVVDKAVGDLALHAALKVRTSPLQSHCNQCPPM